MQFSAYRSRSRKSILGYIVGIFLCLGDNACVLLPKRFATSMIVIFSLILVCLFNQTPFCLLFTFLDLTSSAALSRGT